MFDFDASLEKHVQYPPRGCRPLHPLWIKAGPATRSLDDGRVRALEAGVARQVSELRAGLEGCRQARRVGLLLGEHLASKPDYQAHRFRPGERPCREHGGGTSTRQSAHNARPCYGARLRVAPAIIMSPMKARRALLTHLWLM